MKSEHNIDKLFRENLYSRDIPFDPADWDEAEQLLRDRGKKRFFLYRFRYYLSALLLLIISAAAGWLLISDDQAISEGSMVKTEAQKPASIVPSSSTNTESERFENKEAKSLTLSETANDQKVSLEKQSNSYEENQNPSRRSKVATKKDLNESGNSNPNQTTKPPEKSQYVGDTDDVTHSEDPTQPGGDAVKSNTTESAASPVVSGTIAQVSEQNQDFQQVGKTGATRRANTNSASDEFTASVQEMPYMPTRTTLNYRVPPLELVQPDDKKAKRSDPERLEVNAYSGWKLHLGGGLTQGKENEGESTLAGFSYFAGVSYERKLINAFTGEIGLLFSGRNAFGAVYNQTDLSYDFGYNRNMNTYEFGQLYFAEIPALVNYRFRKKHRIGIGVKYSYLISGKYTQSTTFETSLDSLNANTNQAGTEKEYGTTSGFSQHDFNILLGYDYLLHQKWLVGLQVQVGLKDLTSNSYFLNRADLNHQLRIYLSYKIYK